MNTTNILFLFFSFFGFQSISEKTKNDYKLNPNTNGILVEVFDSTIADANRYNQNNTVYKVGNRFEYKFIHLTPNDKKKYFKINEDGNNWEFVDFDHADSATIQSLIIEVANGNPMAQIVPGYNQTNLMYKLKGGDAYEISGAIENEGNLWIHPPREKYFEILELNPFPYIKAPYEIGTKWTWNLEIGDQWADERWKNWEGRIENKYQYEITGQQAIKTDLGNLECYIIESNAKSSIGESGLIAYFNPKYGFVKLCYINIDGSKTNIELTEHSENENGN